MTNFLKSLFFCCLLCFSFSAAFAQEKDAVLDLVSVSAFAEIGESIPVDFKVTNNGNAIIKELICTYTINGSGLQLEEFKGLNIESGESYEMGFSTPWVPDELGEFYFYLDVAFVNGSTDDNSENNAKGINITVFEGVFTPNKLDWFLSQEVEFQEHEMANSFLDRPTDLAFHPVKGKDELWIVNQRTENVGGATTTIYGATTDNQEYDFRVDGNSWHFMSLPTGIAFSDDNFNFATSAGVQDANHDNGTFTGPSLWSSDPEIYAQPSGGNGSHLDMLHGSPFSMGICHEVDNVFWLYDDWNSDIVRYDFVEDHGPGADDHSDGRVHRYGDMGIVAEDGIPNHLVIDEEKEWLYFADNGNDRVMRLQLNSSSDFTNVGLINEPLAQHRAYTGFVYEEIITEGLVSPCGIAIQDNRLLVSDYATGDIIIYSIELGFVELGRIATGFEGVAGIEIGPNGNIWYVNHLEETLGTLKTEEPLISNTDQFIVSKQTFQVIPNPVKDVMNLKLFSDVKTDEIQWSLINMKGESVMQFQSQANQLQVSISHLAAGHYILRADAHPDWRPQRIVLID